MKVLVYVEGPSDRYGLEALLAPVISEGQRRGVGIAFLPQGGKSAVLSGSARKAADQLADHPDDWVFAAPDLYPMLPHGPDAHGSFAELEQLLRRRFADQGQRLGLPETAYSHFRVHCFKHDLEVLLLAAPEQLQQRLHTRNALGKWRNPVEDQDDVRPPKRVVEELFGKYRGKSRYDDTIDAPWILARASLEEIVKACPQRFAPFVTELRQLARGETLR